MKHARQKIREAVETVISGGISGVTVYRSRAYKSMERPSVSVQIRSESSNMENEAYAAPRRYFRSADLEVEVIAEAVENADDLADDYCAQVEALLDADRTLGSLCEDLELIGTRTRFDGSGDTPLIVSQVNYTVTYRTTGADPETAL